jgi:diguanylate cyclase (GGDEF)-like protein
MNKLSRMTQLNFYQPILRYFSGASLRLGISEKLLLSYLSLLILLFIVSAYALVNLNKLNNMNSSSLSSNVPVLKATENLIDLVIYQEQFARRYVILRDESILNLFRDKETEIHDLIAHIKGVHPEKSTLINRFETLHEEYSALLINDLPCTAETGNEADAQISLRIKTDQEEMIKTVKAIALEARLNLENNIQRSSEKGLMVFKTSAVLFTFGLIVSVGLTLLITKNISASLKKLKKGTELIAQGNYDDIPEITSKDELGDFSTAFFQMAQRLKELEELNLHKSPLTGLIGGVAIERELTQKIQAQKQIAFCLIDIDNFKAYNDHYGYAKGNEIITATANIIRDTLTEYGVAGDFLGHIGGDDFIVITSPERYEIICKSIIRRFDESIPAHYSEDDRKHGFIRAEDRQGKIVNHPLATLSIAVVTNCHRNIEDHIAYGKIAAELKEYVKTLKGSNYMVDRRKTNKRNTGRKNAETQKQSNLQPVEMRH